MSIRTASLVLLVAGSVSAEEAWSVPAAPRALVVTKVGTGRFETVNAPFSLPASGGREIVVPAPPTFVTAVAADPAGCGVADDAPWGAREMTIPLRPWRALSGRVVTPSGQPLPGAIVRWTPIHPAGDALRGGTEARSLLGPQELVTDADGRFHVPAAWAGAWSLQAQAPAWLPSDPVIVPAAPPPADAEAPQAGGAEPAAPVVIRMPSGWSPRGRVIELEGDVERPVAGARVTGEVEGRSPAPTAEIRTDSAGRFALHGFPSGRALLRVSADGFAPSSLHWSPDQATPLVLQRLGGIRFRITEGVEPAFVAAEIAVRQGGQWTAQGAPVAATRQQDGSFVVESVEPGTRSLRLFAPGCLPFVTEPFDVPSGGIVELGELELVPSAIVRGRVVDDVTGEGVSGARVERVDEPDFGMPTTRRFTAMMNARTTTGADGSFTLMGLLPGEWELEALADGRPRASSHRARVVVPEAATDEIAPVTFRMLRPGELLVRVEDARGGAVPGVRLVASEGDGAWGWTGETGADGSVLVGGVAPGKVGVARRDARATTDALMTVDVPSGGRAEAIVRETGTLVRGHVRAEGRVIPARVSLGRYRGGGIAFADSYELRDVPAGMQEVTVTWPLLREDSTFSDQRSASERRTIMVPEGLFEMNHDFEVSLRKEAPPESGGGARVEGRLLDAVTGDPISGRIFVKGPTPSGAHVVSDDEGRFHIELSQGVWDLIPVLPALEGWHADETGVVVVRDGVATAFPDPLVLSARRSRQAHLLLAQRAGERLIPLPGADCALLEPPFAEVAGHVSGRFGMTHSADALGRLVLPCRSDEPADAMCLAHGLGIAFVPRLEAGQEDAPRVVELGAGATLSLPREALQGGWMLAETQTSRQWRLPLDDSSLLRSLREIRDDRALIRGLPAGSWRLVDGSGRGRTLTLETGSVTVVDPH